MIFLSKNNSSATPVNRQICYNISRSKILDLIYRPVETQVMRQVLRPLENQVRIQVKLPIYVYAYVCDL